MRVYSIAQGVILGWFGLFSLLVGSVTIKPASENRGIFGSRPLIRLASVNRF
jgi:hypothetical protein